VKAIFHVCMVWFGTATACFAYTVDIDYIRTQYEKAAKDKNVCETMIAELINHVESDVHLAYLGAYQTIWAKHTLNPFAKLDTFNEGKRNIEKAVLQSSYNAEIRFVRLSVQQNSPGFLGYKDQIKQDKEFLEHHKHTINSAVVLRMVNTLIGK